MKHIEEATLREWMDLDVDGGLDAERRDQLDHHLAARPELAEERGILESLHRLLGDSRIAVQPGFQARVLASLPNAAWQHRTEPRAIPVWGFPLAAMLALALGAAWLLTGTGALTAGAVGGTVAMVLDLAATSALAGSGLLFATWQGIGLGLGEMLGESLLNMLAFGMLVVCVNLLFVSMLRRRPQTAVITVDRDGR